MRALLSTVLIILTFGAAYTEDIYLLLRPPQTGQSIPMSIRTHRSFHFDQEKALGGKRNLALSQYVPLYTYIPDTFQAARKKIDSLIRKVSAGKPQLRSRQVEIADFITKEFGVSLAPEELNRLLAYDNLDNLFMGLLTIEESIFQQKIVQNPEPLAGKPAIEVIYPEPAGIIAHPVGEVLTLDDARGSLANKAGQLFWQVDDRVLQPAVKILAATLSPNLNYDLKENDRRIEEIIRRYPSKVIHYRPGDVLVPVRKTLNEEDVLLLAAYQELKKGNIYGGTLWVLFTIVSLVIVYNLLLSKVFAAGRRRQPPYSLLLNLLIMTVFLFKATLLFTPFPLYALPFCLLPLLLILLTPEKFSAIWTTLVGAMLLALFAARTFEILVFFVFGALVALMNARDIRKRIQILVPSLAAGLMNMAYIMIFSMNWEASAIFAGGWTTAGLSTIDEILLNQAGWGFLGGVIAGPLALALLPLLEFSWQKTASNFKLNHYIDLEQPLMRDLLTKSPGTYQHSMTVAYLAQAAGEAIGANTILLRIGAYYHDIGKILKPKMYVENQFNGQNDHDDLTPDESAKVVINHVVNGRRIGQENGLPEVVVDLIPQHHGTQLVEYFYNKALQSEPENEVNESLFRYPGPKPQSVEAAILMIVDAVEAASRTIYEPTLEKLENLICMIVEKRLADGQFDECDLSTRDLFKIKQALVEALEASFHTRVAYPWQKEEEGAAIQEDELTEKELESG